MKYINKKTAVLAVCAAIVGVNLLLPSSAGVAQNNDAKYDNYQNMDQSNKENTVPSLYQQDSSYKNAQNFPLVVDNETEYVPLDLFATYPSLEVVYSEVMYGFYIHNTETNEYIAFNLESGGIATNDTYDSDVQAEIYNRTYYVPAATVCDAIGLSFETYDDEASGIAAARISDKSSKYTLDDLVDVYTPSTEKEKKDETPAKPADTGNKDTSSTTGGSSYEYDGNIWQTGDSSYADYGNQGSGNSENTEQKDDEKNKPKQDTPIDPYKSVAKRNIYLTFEKCSDDKAVKSILNVLKSKKAQAVFFLDNDYILGNPGTVRRIVAEGHLVGLYAVPVSESGELLTNEQIINQLDSANEMLSVVTKSKTRFIRMAEGYENTAIENGFDIYAEEKGYKLYGRMITLKSGNSGARRAYSALLESVVGERPTAAKNVFVGFEASELSAEVVELMADFCGKYRQFNILPADDFTELPNL